MSESAPLRRRGVLPEVALVFRIIKNLFYWRYLCHYLRFCLMSVDALFTKDCNSGLELREGIDHSKLKALSNEKIKP